MSIIGGGARKSSPFRFRWKVLGRYEVYTRGVDPRSRIRDGSNRMFRN